MDLGIRVSMAFPLALQIVLVSDSAWRNAFAQYNVVPVLDRSRCLVGVWAISNLGNVLPGYRTDPDG